MENKEDTEVQSTETTTPPAPPSSPPSPPSVPAQSSGAEAGLGQRVGAAFIDILIAGALSMVASRINSNLSYLVSAAYLLTRDSLPFLGGQSIGKKALNLQAVTEEGKSLSGNWNPGLLRNITMVIPFMPLVELIIMVVNKDKPEGIRRLGDQIGKTKVITVQPQATS